MNLVIQTNLFVGLYISSKQYEMPLASDTDRDYTHLSRQGRAASIAALGGTQSMGRFSFREVPKVKGLPKSYSVSADGSPSYLTPTQLGRQELYKEVPFTAVFGLQRSVRDMSMAFALSAAELDAMDHEELSPDERSTRMSRASLMILDELEFDANVVTMPLVFAVVIAAFSQFLVGYNTGVMNAPVDVVFPGHSTLAWSLAVASFAIGGPFGALVGGRMADARGRRGALLLDTWLFLAGGALQTLAPDMMTIIVARFIIGFASGYSSVLYVADWLCVNLKCPWLISCLHTAESPFTWVSWHRPVCVECWAQSPSLVWLWAFW